MLNTLDPTAADVAALACKPSGWSVDEVAKLRHDHGNGVAHVTSQAETNGHITTSVEGYVSSTAAAQTMNNVSGRYRSGWQSNWMLELRVDVDGWWPMRLVSGDWYQAQGGTVVYFGSFYASGLTVQATDSNVIVEGSTVRSYTNSDFPRIRVTIPRTATGISPAAATIQFFSEDQSRAGASFVCAFESAYFRTVEYERDVEEGVTQFSSYDTNSLPCPSGWGRVLHETKAYAEAGIQLMPAGTVNWVPSVGSGSDAKWSNAELHASMVNQFSLWNDSPQWKVWLLAAKLHELESASSSLLGIMFDQEGSQRQGCAVFHNSVMGGTDSSALRRQLHTYVHELGHCFNLYHSWIKSSTTPPTPDRPGSLSWMNYPQNYSPTSGTSGAASYWASFPFLFDAYEVAHLRHAFRNNIIMGGNPFGHGAASEADGIFGLAIEDHSGLRIELKSKKSFALGEPVVVEIKLKATDLRGRMVQSVLHPNSTHVQIGIQKPSGEVKIYKPFMHQCQQGAPTKLDEEHPAIYESAYIGYGKDGFYFDQVGNYRVCAVHTALDGSRVVSNVLTLRIRSPLTAADEEVAELFFGSDQGALLWLLGSDASSLQKGNDALDLVLDKHKSHPLAVYAELVKGINEARQFKIITGEKKCVARKARNADSQKHLARVVAQSATGKGVDNITLNMTMRRLARAQKRSGDEKGAKGTMKKMVTMFREKGLKPHVLRDIETQATETLTE